MITTFLSILIFGMAFNCMAVMMLLKRLGKDPAKKLSVIVKEESVLAPSIPPLKPKISVFSQEFSKNKFIPEDIQEKYEAMLQEVIDQLSMIIARKAEDLEKMRQIDENINQCIFSSKRISLTAIRLKNNLDQSSSPDLAEFENIAINNEVLLNTSHDLISDSISTLRDAMKIEGLFVQSTNLLLKDVIQAVVASFIQLSQIQQYDKSIVETVKLPLLVLDEKLRVVSASRAYCSTFETEPSKVVGQVFYVLDDRAWNILELRGLLEKVALEGKPFEDFEVVKKNPGSGEMVLLVSGRPLQQNTGRENMILVSMEDVTRRRIAEKNLEKSLETIRQYADDLEQKNQELDEFVYAASHDLQEPLRRMISFSDLLKTEIGSVSSENTKTYLNYIVESAMRMQKLIQDLLQLSRSGRTELEPATISLDDCVQQAISVLSDRIKTSGASVTVESLPMVYGDTGLITQVYVNLIGNALKFSDPGPAKIRVFALKNPDGFIFGVEDNGIGIELAYHDQIFTPFKRLHGKHRFEGSGIGLSICQKVVSRHNGRIWVESDGKTGSCFKFTLGTQQTLNKE